MTNEEAMKLLKPCPRCGNKAPLLYSFGDNFIVHCGRYMCDLKYSYITPTREGCIKAWNELQREAEDD